ncbi:hypothetical protein [Bradyrhizobium sp. NAS96.2]|uniref:hypothetical protein n=1 Tax=Bradyrhizobium sp. NAS96.2 TaxID=1680160 RepID=UPI0011611EBD|nr:hypothetical protein [Bradyrhizobium sp. NAS96.2]
MTGAPNIGPGPGNSASREHCTETNSDTHLALFVRDGNSIPFPDFPEHLDVPGELEIMLWKEYGRAEM